MHVGEITAREAARNGDKAAIVEPASGRTLTFAQLEGRVDRLARALLARPGVAHGDRIAILADNATEYVELYLAAARAGLVAHGLNWRLAADELERVTRDADPRVLVTQDVHAAAAEELSRRVDVGLRLQFGPDSDGSYEELVASGASAPPPDREPDPSDPLLIIYTGGSTGEPKGAVHTGSSCLGAMVINTVAERVVGSDRYLMLGQMFHSAAILALNYLMHGATLVLVPRFEPRVALEVMESERVTASLAFPAMINYLLAAADDRRYDLSSLRNVQYGGGPIAPRVIEEMMDVLDCGLIQCYGSSEHVGVAFLSQEDHAQARASGDREMLRRCGREAYLTRVRLIDEAGAPVPWDGRTPGEIVVRSPANMAGYWRRPDLTAAATHDGWLGTGDLAVGDERGYLRLVDRIKDVVISGGENIYPAQVENAIAGHPAVLEVAVVGAPDELWGEAVHAFVVLRAGRAAGAEDIRRAVADTLGSYQKPREVHFVAELPKTPAGKIAKRTLRERLGAGATALAGG